MESGYFKQGGVARLLVPVFKFTAEGARGGGEGGEGDFGGGN